MKGDIKAIVFDVDGTLVDHSIWNFLTVYLGGSWEEHLDILTKIRTKKIDNSEGLNKIKNIWISTNKATKEKFESAYREIPLRDGALEMASALKDKYHLCIVTGSMDVYSKIIAERLGITSYYWNTVLEWGEEGQLKEIHQGKESQKEVKLKQVDDFCKRLNIKPEQCVAVGDGENDMKIFSYTGRGVFIKSNIEVEDGSLESYAWKSIQNLKDLKSAIES